ncbi:MAG: hypothetical protein RLZZ526_797 [Actinomycetota bacterium]|jgi:hypothetical protein
MAVARAGAVLTKRARAQACADAVALAWATGGVNKAEHVAHISRSLIVDQSTFDGTVHVVVKTDGVTASSTARG